MSYTNHLKPASTPPRVTNGSQRAASITPSRIALVLPQVVDRSAYHEVEEAAPRGVSVSRGNNRIVRPGSNQNRTALQSATPNGVKTTTASAIPAPHLPNPHAPSLPAHAVTGAPIQRARGRPRGWRPGMTYTQVRALGAHFPSSFPSSRTARGRPSSRGYRGRRGRPPRQVTPPPRELYASLEPEYVSFMCEWGECSAELHNLDTLRRHIRKVHVQKPPSSRCAWAKCAYIQDDDEKMRTDGEGIGLEIMRHVEKTHLLPLAWKAGDGPMWDTYEFDGKEGGNHKKEEDQEGKEEKEEDVPSYLKDVNGVQITPSIKDQQIEDVATWKSRRRELRELLRLRDENLPDEETDDDDEDEENDGETDSSRKSNSRPVGVEG